jgi:endonuclease/exonuclease/phosphatase (EEP) superfamily protein YafD
VGVVLARLASVYVVAAILVLLVGLVIPTDNGPLGLLAVLSPHIALAALVGLPIALAVRSPRLGAGLIALAVLFGVRFGGDWSSFGGAASASAPTIDVATWNVEAGRVGGGEAVDVLVAHPVEILVLEELTPPVAAAIEANDALVSRFPFRELHPNDGVAGIGILSAFPMREARYESPPIRLEIHVALPDGDLIVIGAHPFHADISLTAGLPSGLNATRRNRDLALLRDRVTELEAAGERVVLTGDFNTAASEPAFADLTAGLHDAHADAGVGPGWTWRPSRFAFLGFGLLRIDLILSTAELEPIRVGVDCPTTGDHCLVEATLQIGS